MLVSDVIDKCYLMFNEETPATPIYLSRADLLSFVNTTVQVIAENTEAFVKYKVLRLEAYRSVYNLPRDLRLLLWVWFNDKSLEPSSIRRWTEADSEWRTKTSATPEEYALDATGRDKITLWKTPTADGAYGTIVKARNGILVSMHDAYRYRFYNQDGLFQLGETVTFENDEDGTVDALEQNGSYGSIYIQTPSGVPELEESITGETSGATAVLQDIDEDSANEGGSDGTMTFVTKAGQKITTVAGVPENTWEDIAGFEDEPGDVYNDVENNLLLMYCYYPGALAETDALPSPYDRTEEIWTSYVMAQMYLVESTQQDIQKVGYWIQRFATLTGIDMKKLWTPQREYVPQAKAESVTQNERRMSVRLPEGY